MIVTSKFRIGFWIQSFIIFFVWLSVDIFLVLYPFNDINIDFRDISFWIGVFASIWLFCETRKFLLNTLRQICVTENKIKIKYLFSGKTESVSYTEILGFKTKRSKSSSDEGTQVYGSQTLEITLINDSIITFDADQFDNYKELKSLIYSNYKSIQE